jgi:hypothetical protein
MFNNKFLKNDPLLEAVKAARADGDARRLAESMANDLFGVFSRKAVVREHLSDYDFALEEAYKCMKEEDKMADKDYDRDGKIETSKKEVWGSRLRAAKASGKYKGPVDEKKMWEGSGVSGEDPGMEVAKQAGARQQAQTPSSTPARTGNAAGATIAKAKDALNELTKPTAKTAMKALDRAERSDDESDSDYKRSNRLYRWKQKNLPGKSARNQKDTGKAELPSTGNVEFHKAGYSGHVTKSGKLTKSATKDTKAEIKSRLGKHTKPKHLPEEQIDEISKELAGRYIKQADYKRSDSSFQSGKVYGKELATKRRTKQDVEDARKHNRDAYKREKGINTAVNKLTGRAKVAANEEVMKESIIAKVIAKHMKEEQGF